ncbi:MAG: 2-amino-4-hydroxy-6-hydroxymethyldihydropteridine diphosphokinase [Sphingobacteriaceae bacterium]|nr:2-amino-4-hydroxy-6-hydroxymethyldihydropteridine diphosphokinase [Sphingobacteriaceae bacterium]
MKEAILCLGSNLGNRYNTLKVTRNLIARFAGKLVASSKIYETEPWESKSHLKYLNQVIIIQTQLTAPSLLRTLLKIEKKLGRIRTDEKNGDRSCDIDILFFERMIFSKKQLTIPHPQIENRMFVLKPLMDVAANYKHPINNKTIKQLYKSCADKLHVKLYQKPIYVCIEGNIGSGKSTFAKEISQLLKAKYLPEEFEKNSLLPLFYEKPEQFALILENSFLLSRFQQMKNVFDTTQKAVISDYTFYKCLWFAKINLKNKDYKIFKKHFQVLNDELPKPDLIIYLKATIPQIQKNIKARARKFEEKIDSTYLKKIAKTYQAGLEDLNSIKILQIPVDGYELKHTKRLINEIKSEINQLQNE